MTLDVTSAAVASPMCVTCFFFLRHLRESVTLLLKLDLFFPYTVVHLKHCAQFCFSNLAIFALKSLAKHDFVLDFFSLRPGVQHRMRRDAQRGLRLRLPGERGRPRGVPDGGHCDVDERAVHLHKQKRLPRHHRGPSFTRQILLKVLWSENSKSFFSTLFFHSATYDTQVCAMLCTL